MNLTLKIALGAICSIILAFSILVIVDFFQEYSFQNAVKGFSKKYDAETQMEEIEQTKFLSQHFDPNENMIFLIGSSHIKSLNTTYIQEQLSKNNQNFDVYNLARGGDTPQDRLKSLDLLISSKPKIVVYGIAYRDLMDQSPSEQLDEKSTSLLPDPHDFFSDLSMKLSSNYDLGFMENPKLVTLKALQSLIDDVSESIKNKTTEDNLLVRPYPNAFFNESRNDIPKSDVDLKHMFAAQGATFNKIRDYNKNVNVIALKEIITKLQKNGIKIIIFTTPQSKYYLNLMPIQGKTVFDTIIQNLEKDYKIKIYTLQDKYKDLNIWYDPQHVAIFNNTEIYSEDIAKIILGEIDS